ncbi:hypothetical protein NK214_24655 [Chromobacterium sp. S0633]|uniref:hypothetical protein n=1 Tax=Chromobacterium sp. S0633 TaxID=2957805 RepID=UPI00209D2860|nr:hypothetical protein [Chromobacterium sp. S0633]MCP1293373.1 hypothetical protein [Chromobacterium sp. S0633]
MRIVQGHFDDLHFTEACFGRVLIQERTISIQVQGVSTMAGYPLAKKDAGLISGMLLFRGVITSHRTLTEYIGNPRNPDGFKEDYVLEDLPPVVDDSGTRQLYSFEGLLENPVAWVDWDIEAKSFEFVIDD